MGLHMSFTSSRAGSRARFGLVLVFAACVAALFGGVAKAKDIKVYALGASNTNGKGVNTSQAWPAQLERMLRAKGYDAKVDVNAINGDTSEGVLNRTSGIPPGTQVVVFDTGGDNDRLRGRSEGQIKATRAQIVAAIRTHHAVAIQAPYRRLIGPQRSDGSGYQPDGIHLTVASHARIAAYLLPKVIAAAK
jgi:acyl-CoA thioesterase I